MSRTPSGVAGKAARTPFIAGNWKMNKTIAEAEEFIQALLPKVSTADGVDVAVCAPFLALQALVDSARGSRVQIFAQTMHEADEGAFTGEVSPRMLAEIDVAGVVLGHSERRQLFGETDRALALKVPAALEAGLHPDPVRGRDRGGARARRHRAQAAPPGPGGAREGRASSGSPRSSWPTSRSGRSGRAAARRPSRRRRPSPSCARSSRASTRTRGQAVRILYGGSLKPENAEELLALPDVDGALVGGA